MAADSQNPSVWQLRRALDDVLRQLRADVEGADLDSRLDGKPSQSLGLDERRAYSALSYALAYAEGRTRGVLLGEHGSLRRKEEAASLSRRVQVGLDLENHGDRRNYMDSVDRQAAVKRRAASARNRGRLRSARDSRCRQASTVTRTGRPDREVADRGR